MRDYGNMGGVDSIKYVMYECSYAIPYGIAFIVISCVCVCENGQPLCACVGADSLFLFFFYLKITLIGWG